MRSSVKLGEVIEAKLMVIAVPRDRMAGETRTALVPRDAERLAQLNARARIETGLGEEAGFSDAAYSKAGATVARNPAELLDGAEMLLGLNPPERTMVALMRPGTIHIGFLDPFRNAALLGDLAGRGVSAVCLELMPRSTRAQGMDALTSQASVAGYVSVVMAAGRLRKILPMMSTAAGTIAPAKVLVLGAGVAGLQAVATARRLGAAVQAFDTRPDVEEQVRSLGARFLRIDVGRSAASADGYAKALGERQMDSLRSALIQRCAEADIVITAAQVFGRRAPVLVTPDTLARMAPGSVVVDLAVESGGNVAGVTVNAVTDVSGVTVIAWRNLATQAPATASQLFSANVTNVIEEFWDKTQGRIALRLEDDLLKACLATHDGKICHPQLREFLQGRESDLPEPPAQALPETRQAASLVKSPL